MRWPGDGSTIGGGDDVAGAGHHVGAAGLEGAAGRRVDGDGISPLSTTLRLVTRVSAMGTADSSASV